MFYSTFLDHSSSKVCSSCCCLIISWYLIFSCAFWKWSAGIHCIMYGCWWGFCWYRGQSARGGTHWINGAGADTVTLWLHKCGWKLIAISIFEPKQIGSMLASVESCCCTLSLNSLSQCWNYIIVIPSHQQCCGLMIVQKRSCYTFKWYSRLQYYVVESLQYDSMTCPSKSYVELVWTCYIQFPLDYANFVLMDQVQYVACVADNW